jgi:SAM-dependent methyltransferase
MNGRELVKKEFDFGWKGGKRVEQSDLFALEYQKGDILDVGCGTGRLYKLLKERGWNGQYIGLDIKKHEDYAYPDDIKLIISDAFVIPFPEVDTVVLNNILEHVDDPVTLLSKAIDASRENVLINVPKRNEEMWTYCIAEFHQLDKTHKHCGFSKEEIYNIVDLSGGKIREYKDVVELKATMGVFLWNGIIPKAIFYLMSKIFSSKTFYGDIWCEVVKKA